MQNKERNLLDESSKDTLLSETNKYDMSKWHAIDFCGYLTLNALPFVSVNVNVLKWTSLQFLWNMLQSLKDRREVVFSSINIKKWFLNFIQGITVLKMKTSWYL